MKFKEKILNIKDNLVKFTGHKKMVVTDKITAIVTQIKPPKNEVNTIENIDEKLDQNNWKKTKLIFDNLVEKVKPEDIKKISQIQLEKMKKGPIKDIWQKIQALSAMMQSPNVAWKSKAIAIATLIYLISPFDAIPDIIPLAGLADDAALIMAVVSTISYELENYLVRQAEKQAEIEIKKQNKIVRIGLIGSIAAAILAIIVKLILTQT